MLFLSDELEIETLQPKGQIPLNGLGGGLWPQGSLKPAFAPAENALTAVEVCAGAGGQALGFEEAGIDHACLIELDHSACETLRLNRPCWKIYESDVRTTKGASFEGCDLLSGGLPCPPFSVAGKQLGSEDERNLFPTMIRLASEVRPKAIMIENVRGILDPVFDQYRAYISGEFKKQGYRGEWKLLNASDYGVSQLRPRAIFIALARPYCDHFSWPAPMIHTPRSVGDVLFDLMAESGWIGAEAWRVQANRIAPTIVGGSHKHGGPDLGPTRARRAWAALGVDGLGIANHSPEPDFEGMPKLTVRMVARLQGFPDLWRFAGKKTASYRQVGNAFPPPVARAIAERLKASLTARRTMMVKD